MIYSLLDKNFVSIYLSFSKFNATLTIVFLVCENNLTETKKEKNEGSSYYNM